MKASTLKRPKLSPGSFRDVALDKPVMNWKEEDRAVKRWHVRKQLVACSRDKGVEMLNNYFAAKAPSTLLKRTNSITRYSSYLADTGMFPGHADAFY